MIMEIKFVHHIHHV
jgi:hypothetical protein